jgi:glyoxylase-like metal-dependent hydrolase (beta-lactamase superfamily II)
MVYGSDYKGLIARPIQFAVLRVGERIYPVERSPDFQCLAGGDILAAPSGDLKVIHCPGHTPGHIAFYRSSDGVLFSGDAVMNIVPHLLPSRRRKGLSLPLRLFTSDWGMAKQSARKLAELRPKILAAGHGRPLTEETADRLEAWANGQECR